MVCTHGSNAFSRNRYRSAEVPGARRKRLAQNHHSEGQPFRAAGRWRDHGGQPDHRDGLCRPCRPSTTRRGQAPCIASHQPQTCCNNSSSDGLLARKKQQTAREVKRARRTWHRTENPRLECTVGEHTTVHSTVLSPVLIDLQPWASTPFAVSLCSPAGHASNIGGRAQRRCKCARCTPLVPNLSLPPRKP